MQLNTTLSAGISNSEDGEVQLGYQTQIRIAQVVTVAVTILGLVGNTLAYLTADHFPQKTSGGSASCALLCAYVCVRVFVCACVSVC